MQPSLPTRPVLRLLTWLTACLGAIVLASCEPSASPVGRDGGPDAAAGVPARSDAVTACRYTQIRLNDIFRGNPYIQLRPVGAAWEGSVLTCLIRQREDDGRVTARMTCETLPMTGGAECFEPQTIEIPYGNYLLDRSG
jgi:hypothetical protein